MSEKRYAYFIRDGQPNRIRKVEIVKETERMYYFASTGPDYNKQTNKKGRVHLTPEAAIKEREFILKARIAVQKAAIHTHNTELGQLPGPLKRYRESEPSKQ